MVSVQSATERTFTASEAVTYLVIGQDVSCGSNYVSLQTLAIRKSHVSHLLLCTHGIFARFPCDTSGHSRP